MRRRLTILSLLCALVAAAIDIGQPIGSRFSGANVRLGPNGALILFGASQAKLARLDEHQGAFRKLGIEASHLSGDGSGWIVLNAKHIIVAKYDPSDTPAAILIHQFGWTPEPLNDIEGKQLTARIGASDSSVAPGDRVALTLDVDLEPNMHVYAPGVEGYIPIDWKVQQSAAAQVHEAVFPRAEKLYLKAIDETVPAYRNHFRLIRDLTIGAGTPGQLAVEGSLRYQACDDRVCYIPQTLALHWTFDRR